MGNAHSPCKEFMPVELPPVVAPRVLDARAHLHVGSLPLVEDRLGVTHLSHKEDIYIHIYIYIYTCIYVYHAGSLPLVEDRLGVTHLSHKEDMYIYIYIYI